MKEISISQYLEFSPEVLTALRAGTPVVAFETGFYCRIPYERNLRTLQETERIIWSENCVPAPIAVVNGRFRAGLNAAEKEALMQMRVSAERAELPALAAAGKSACCAPSAAMAIAKMAGIVPLVLPGVRDALPELDSMALYDRLLFVPRLSAEVEDLLKLRSIPLVRGSADELSEAWLCQEALRSPEAVVFDDTESWVELCRTACAAALELRKKEQFRM